MSNFQKQKYIYIFITTIFLIVIISSKFYYQPFSSSQRLWLTINSAIGVLMLFFSVLSWIKLTREILSLFLIYYVLTYLFTFGQSLLILFNLVDEKYNLLSRVDVNTLINSQFFTLMCLNLFYLGGLLICEDSKNYLRKQSNSVNQNNYYKMIHAIKIVGKVLFCLSLPGFIYDSIITIQLVLQGGYGAIYGYHTNVVRNVSIVSRIFSETANYFIPSIICLFISYKEIKRKRIILMNIILLYLINALFIGGRGRAVSLIITFLLIYHFIVNKFDWKKMFKIGVFSYLFVSFLSVVAQLRNIVNKSSGDYFRIFFESLGKDNLFMNTISEIGWTMYPLSAVMSIVPSRYGYLYGKSYYYALTSIIPNLGFWDLHPAKLYSGGAQWLMDTLNLWSGPGFTLIADAYRNFGWFGCVIFLIWGVFFGKIYTKVDTSTINTNPKLLCLTMIFFAITATSVRGDNLSIVRPLFYVILPINLFISIVYKRITSQ